MACFRNSSRFYYVRSAQDKLCQLLINNNNNNHYNCYHPKINFLNKNYNHILIRNFITKPIKTTSVVSTTTVRSSSSSSATVCKRTSEINNFDTNWNSRSPSSLFNGSKTVTTSGIIIKASSSGRNYSTKSKVRNLKKIDFI